MDEAIKLLSQLADIEHDDWQFWHDCLARTAHHSLKWNVAEAKHRQRASILEAARNLLVVLRYQEEGISS